jgi:hypothetical protein
MSNAAQLNKKIRLSYCLPEGILVDIKNAMVQQGYDLRGKSKWISEAIHQLLAMPNYSDLVMINDQMDGFEKMDSVSIDVDLKEKLDKAILVIRTQFPIIEGVQSKILRTAIVQRLLR